MSRLIVTVICAVLAVGSAAGAVEAWGDVLMGPSVHAWSIAGFVTLRTAVLFALSFCVFVRKPPRRHSRDPIAFVACAVALGGESDALDRCGAIAWRRRSAREAL